MRGTAGKAADAGGPPVGRWLVTADLHGTPVHGRLEIEQQGDWDILLVKKTAVEWHKWLASVALTKVRGYIGPR
jgi:hypothetical protein